MKNTLSANTLLLELQNWPQLHDSVINSVDSTQEKHVFVSGLKGSLTSFFVSQAIDRIRVNCINYLQYSSSKRDSQEECPSSDFVIIVPSQKEADEVQTDLETILADKAQIMQLPWWGMIPYRAAAKGSAVFGQRAGVLAKMSLASEFNKIQQFLPRIFIITERALLTPVPPPSYVRKHLFTLRKGQTFDVQELVEKLTGEGYIRVPKVGMKGELALRGEVLDIFMPGEELAVRIVFDFDTIEQIKTFDVESQSTKYPLETVTIYPMKEVVWDDSLVEKLEEILKKEDSEGIVNDFASYDLKKKAGTLGTEDDAGKDSDDLRTDNTGTKDNVSLQTENDAGIENSALGTDKASFEKENVHLAFTDFARTKMENMVTELSVSHETEGEELFYGILWDKQYSVLDYVKKNTIVFCYDYDRLVNAQRLLENEYNTSYRTARLNLPVLPPETMLFDFSEVLEGNGKDILFKSLENADEAEAAAAGGFAKTASVYESDNSASNSTGMGKGLWLEITAEAPQSYFGNINYLKEQLAEKQNDGWKIYVFADNENQSLRIHEILKEFTEPEGTDTTGGLTIKPLEILPQPITQGFTVTDEKILVIQENQIFGRRNRQVPKSIRRAKSAVIDTFVELNPGDFVVHVNYGIGLFKGIERVKAMGTERDYIKLEYADEEFVFVPIEQVNMVQRYIGSESEKPRLDRIGSKSWSARKSKVQEKVEEIAEKLIDLYSKRKASRGYSFPKDTEWQAAFEAAFPYEDTPDQLTVTQEVKADMEKDVPMDRLVCGDVGYGKTEIAMRSCFKAVMGGKQVAFLAPTTILAEQHYENCLERFKNFPVQIAHLSRFVPPAEQKKILKRLAAGEIDILIGTHRIIQKDVIFKDLGLMIIDEEQRFGVKDKEKLKTLKTNIDCLAMSATPIPRTLHMSLLKIRDMSLLTTAPQNRQPVETTISEYSEERVAQAIRREVERGGQIFYLHNRVESLEETRYKLQQLVPEMMIDVAHGQMSSEQLDDIFRRFKMGGFHILVSTTIIENGIDIPNVNTIIIDRADMYGVSQLYQLRGRVGRSDRKAYAYLFYPENKALSEVAMKRLQVISDFTELGSGFKIAMKDMEIRGAGNLLGKDQSGEVYAVGFEMYLQLLNSAIERLTNENWHAPDEVLLELEYTGFIPDSYIPTAEMKMEIYKKIASIQTDEERNAVYDELYDRFGPIPDEVNSLLNLAKIRIICHKLSISSLKERGGKVTVVFSQVAKISIDKVLRLIKTSSGRVKLDSQHPNQLMLLTGNISLNEKSDFILDNLNQIA